MKILVKPIIRDYTLHLINEDDFIKECLNKMKLIDLGKCDKVRYAIWIPDSTLKKLGFGKYMKHAIVLKLYTSGILEEDTVVLSVYTQNN